MTQPDGTALLLQQRLDGEILAYAAKKLSEIRLESAPNREERDVPADGSGSGAGEHGARARADVYSPVDANRPGDAPTPRATTQEASSPMRDKHSALFSARDLFVQTMRREPTEREWFQMRLAAARGNRNRKVRCERYHSRVDQHLVHSVRVDDRRGNFKESLGCFTVDDCPLCVEGL